MKKDGDLDGYKKSTDVLLQTLNRLNEFSTEKHSDSIYLRRNIRIYLDNSLHIIKPNEKRFWTKSMALRDADETLAEGIRQESELC